MLFRIGRALSVLLGATFPLVACGGSSAIPNQSNALASHVASTWSAAAPADTTSILKLLTKDVTIGSTVDPTNGDKGPRAVTVVQKTYGKLKEGDVLVCNFESSSGAAGDGTTVDQFAPATNSKAATFILDKSIEGCDGTALTGGEQMYSGGLTSKSFVWVNENGQLKKTYGSPITDPLGDGDAPTLYGYSPEYIFIGNADTGAMDSLSLDSYGTGKPLEVVNGFEVNNGSGWSALGPSGISYWCGSLPGSGKCKRHGADVLYVADGACNTVVAISHASTLLVKDEITVQPGCKKFTCLYPKTTCATVVKTGSPLDKPVAQAILPNGNLIEANTGNNTLVELTPTGQILDTKVLDKSKKAGIFGIFAIGKSDKTTALYYTDTNTNTLHELEQ